MSLRISNSNEKSCSLLSKCSDSVLLFIAKIYSRYPFLTLVICLAISIVLTWLGLSNGFPEFEDPYLGFETRNTPISNRLVTLENFRRAVNNLDPIENYPSERITERDWKRKKRQLWGSNFCSNYPLDEYARIALELKPQQNIFTLQHISLICYFEKLIIHEIDLYPILCEKGENFCCPMWSIANYIAIYSNKTDCAMLQEEDIRRFQFNLNQCRDLYLNETMEENCRFKSESCPEICHRGNPIHTALFQTIDNSYIKQNSTRFSMIILPIPKSQTFRDTIEDFQESVMRLHLPKNSSISLEGLDFGGKDSIFKRYLIKDLEYVGLASLIIFALVCIYTKSLFVTVISFMILTLSLGVSYFFYLYVFKIPYFPFMNMLVTIIILGIGTDGTLILSVVWQRSKLENSQCDVAIRELLMFKTLKETTITLLITTSTTSGAFLASLASSITTIKCFSVFAGTAIITSFILLYISVPISFILSDKLVNYFHSILFTPNEGKGRGLYRLKKYNQKMCEILNEILHYSRHLTKYENHPKSATSAWIITFLACLSVFLWSLIIVFYSPGFQLPNSEQFQLLSDSHPLEKFDQQVEKAFQPVIESKSAQAEELTNKMTLYFIWGLKDTDNGYSFDPNDDGILELDKSFALESRESQLWIRGLCRSLKEQSFYDGIANSVVGNEYDSCFIETMIQWMNRDCLQVFSNISYVPCCRISSFPFDPDVFSQCIGLAARDVYRTPSLYFKPDIAGPKFLVSQPQDVNGSDVSSTELIKTRSDKKLASFALRVKTNVSFSLSYEKMNEFYKSVERFFKPLMEKGVPQGLERGFFISAHLDFYDLQVSLASDTQFTFLLSSAIVFIFILISSRNLTIALGAVLTIFASVVVSSSLLIQIFHWKLGVFESIAVTVAVGLSDFTAHHAIEYSKRESVIGMTSPTFFSALTTITMGASMMIFSNVLVYQQIGSFFVVLIIVSWIYSVFFLSPILTIFGFAVKFGSTFIRWIFRRKKPDEEEEEEEDDLQEEVSDSTVLENKQSILMEKWKLLKKMAQETSV